MELGFLLSRIRAIHERVREAVVAACESCPLDRLTAIDRDDEGDTIYAIDRVSEATLVDLFEKEIAVHDPILLIAEGLPGGKIALPRGGPVNKAVWQIIADPIDGTRCLMYQKRSGWILTGVARSQESALSLADIELAVQTEVPLIKQHLCDSLWAVRGSGVCAERLNRLSRERKAFTPRPSTATNLDHGFSSISRFFSGGRDVLAAIDDEIALTALGPGSQGKGYSFEDQYLSTGGQLYELMMGHDRFLADLRPLLLPKLRERGLPSGLCCHPYDLSTELIAREAGVLITDESGLRLQAPLNVNADVCWIGYANARIRARVEPSLRSALSRQGLLDWDPS